MKRAEIESIIGTRQSSRIERRVRCVRSSAHQRLADVERVLFVRVVDVLLDSRCHLCVFGYGLTVFEQIETQKRKTKSYLICNYGDTGAYTRAKKQPNLAHQINQQNERECFWSNHSANRSTMSRYLTSTVLHRIVIFERRTKKKETKKKKKKKKNNLQSPSMSTMTWPTTTAAGSSSSSLRRQTARDIFDH
jgi:hypothetical protein